MKLQDIVIFVVTTVLSGGTTVQGMVEECPSYCSPVNNNYGPACASISGKSGTFNYWTFPNLCELFKHRCFNQRTGGPAIEFASDGACSSSAKKTSECQVVCSPENNKFGSVCASVGGSYRTYPNLCVMLKEKCTNERSGQPEIKYQKDGSCSIPLRNEELERSPKTPQEPEFSVQIQEERQLMEEFSTNDA